MIQLKIANHISTLKQSVDKGNIEEIYEIELKMLKDIKKNRKYKRM